MVGLASVTLLKLSALASVATSSGRLSLAWDPSPDSTVVGYRFYLGGSSQVYTNIIDVGNHTSISISNLIPGTTCFFAVTAYDANGAESAFSGEITYTVPASTPPSSASTLCPVLTRDSLGQMNLSGTAQTGSTYQVWASQDLLTWLIIGTVIIDATDSFQFTDPLSVGVPVGFYRLRQTATQALSTNQPESVTGSLSTRTTSSR